MSLPVAPAVVYDYTSIQAPGSYLAFAGMQYGSNGDPDGSATELGVNNNNDDSTGRIQWDTSDFGDAFDSGWVEFTFDAKAGGNTTLTVNGSTTSPASVGSAFSGISAVTISAGVQTSATAGFEGLSVTFLDSEGNSTSNCTDTDGPSVDQTGPDSIDLGEEDLVVTPALDTSAAEVIITGQIRLSAPAGTYPNPGDIFGNILVS